ncbi:attachment/invasion protein [Salmonella enterica subsp. enterica]|nr:attachment/invasion protein [Salmonella enterica subsp. enterica]VUC86917.1 attachment/invasion protein [Salmonella sp. NCTC 11881]
MKKIVVAVLVGLALGSIGVANAAGYKKYRFNWICLHRFKRLAFR